MEYNNFFQKFMMFKWASQRDAPTLSPFILLCLTMLFLVGCQNGEVAQPAAEALRPSATFQPTPTLVPGLPTATVTAVDSAETGVTSAQTITEIPTVTPLPTATPIPNVTERFEIARRAMHNGDYDAAIANFASVLAESNAFTLAQIQEAQLLLGIAYYENGRFQDALNTFEQLHTTDNAPSASYWYMAQANTLLGDYDAAIANYQTYLSVNPEMGAYTNRAIGDIYLTLGDAANAQSFYELAAAEDAHYVTKINIHRQLADFYLNAGNTDAAIAQYDAARDLAFTEFTKGELTYLAGSAALAAGNTDVGYGRFQQGVTQFPQAYESYLGLVQLVEAGIAVDDFQRGLVDFHADAFDPAIGAFQAYLANNPETARADAYLYLAWSYEALGDLPSALLQLDQYAVTDPAGATIERGKMLARAGDVVGAVDQYQNYLTNYPDGEKAPFAAWWSAALAPDTATSIERYQFLVDNYGWHEDAPEALFQAGWLAKNRGDVSMAVSFWNRAVQTYPNTTYGGAAAVWLMRTLQENLGFTFADGTTAEELLTAVKEQAVNNTLVDYYPLRAEDMGNDLPAFYPTNNFAKPDGGTQATLQAEAETWLRTWLGLEAGADVRTLSPTLASDPRLIRGQELWQAGEYELAKAELESLRFSYQDDALSSYQLALFLRDLGLYRSSILAAARLYVLSGESVFNTPKFIGQLAYPIYYDDLLVPLADQYGYDPRLQFALVRQESLFESFATSSAVAQGLSQVIPDTGAFIAQRLSWPNYENEDLYKPYVGLNFGAYYLDWQLDSFNDSVHAALSAYNAGPGNAARWYEIAGDDHDLYTEVVNFAETRLYIERIYEGYVIYRYLYGE